MKKKTNKDKKKQALLRDVLGTLEIGYNLIQDLDDQIGSLKDDIVEMKKTSKVLKRMLKHSRDAVTWIDENQMSKIMSRLRQEKRKTVHTKIDAALHAKADKIISFENITWRRFIEDSIEEMIEANEKEKKE